MARLFPSMGNFSSEESFLKKFGKTKDCIEFLCDQYTGGKITCKKCKTVTHHEYYAPYHSYKCQECGNHYQPIMGTMYQKGGIPLNRWFRAIYLYTHMGNKLTPYIIADKINIDIKRARYVFKMLQRLS